MEVCSNPTPPRSKWSSSFLCGLSSDHQRRIESIVSAVLGNLFYAIIAVFLGVVGMTLGAVTGAVSGLKSKRGFFHGAAAGAYFFLEFVEASIGFWNSYADGPLSFLLLIKGITTLLNPILLYFGELFGPVRNQDVDDQVHTVETINEVPRLVHRKGARGSAGGIPKTRITGRNIYDASGNRSTCSVCLEDFQLGEVAAILPECHHMFHQPCIAKWRTRHSSCPLCRRNQ